jgi:hypothetical protein
MRSERQRNKIVIIDPAEIAALDEQDLRRTMSRPESVVLREIRACAWDALGTGRPIAETVINAGKGVTNATKATLGLIPPTN